MHETLEYLQLNSRKIIDGDIKVYFSLILLLFVAISGKLAVYVVVFLTFSCLSFYAVGSCYFRIIKIPIYFLVSGIAIILLFTPGKTAYNLYFFKISEEGVFVALNTTLRALASLSVMSFLILTTTVPEIFSAIKKLKLPDFVVEMSLLIYRVIQILVEEMQILEKSAKSRLGYANKRVFVNTTALLSYSLFLKSIKRSEKLDLAMQARCYSGVMPVPEMKNVGKGYALAISLLFVVVQIL